jgi:hypothetical protein
VKRILWAAAVCVLAPAWAVGGEACETPACPGPGGAYCGKTCKVVREMKKVTKTVWVVECEEFCPSLPGCACGCSCGKTACDGTCDDQCASLRRPMTPPTCCAVRTRKKLVKKEIECEVPVYKCVVVACGEGCGDRAAAPAKVAPSAAAAPMPPMPLVTPARP